MLEILDAVIATAAVTLALSLIVQAIQQIFKQLLDLKSTYMRAELLALFASDESLPSLRPTWRSNLRPLNGAQDHVDDVSKRIVSELEDRMSTFGLTDLHLLEGVDAAKLKEIIVSLPVARDASLREKFEKAFARIDLWIDIGRKAFQEHYERRMRVWSVGLSAAVVIVLNANIFDVYSDFSHSKPLREAAIAMGQRLVAIPRDSLIIIPGSIIPDSGAAGATLDSLRLVEIKKQIGFIHSIIDEESFQLLGWTKARLDKYKTRPWYLNVTLILLGWAGMTLLVSLGAPFWYDFLKTVTGLKDKLKVSSAPAESGAAPPALRANQVAATSPDIPPVG